MRDHMQEFSIALTAEWRVTRQKAITTLTKTITTPFYEKCDYYEGKVVFHSYFWSCILEIFLRYQEQIE